MAGGVALVELVLLVICGLVLVGRSLAPQVHAAATRAAAPPKHVAAAASHRRHAAKPKPAAKPHARHTLSRSRTGVLILNGNGISGAAAQAATIIRARGYLVTDAKNAPRTGYLTWHLMAAPGYAVEARRFARDLDLARSRVGPLDGMTTRQLHGARLVLILGTSR